MNRRVDGPRDRICEELSLGGRRSDARSNSAACVKSYLNRASAVWDSKSAAISNSRTGGRKQRRSTNRPCVILSGRVPRLCVWGGRFSSIVTSCAGSPELSNVSLGEFRDMLWQRKIFGALALVLFTVPSSGSPLVCVGNGFQQFGTIDLSTRTFSGNMQDLGTLPGDVHSVAEAIDDSGNRTDRNRS
jgi:hypothetical protein